MSLITKLFASRDYRSGMGISAGFTIASKGVGYIRQLLMAYYFGISRDLDIYFMAYGLAMMLIFPSTTWFDKIVIPQLVRTREKDGEPAFQRLAGSTFSISLCMALGVAVLFFIILPVIIWLLAHGFSSHEKIRLHQLALYFVPWILVIYPYNALLAFFKSLRHFGMVLSADFAVSVIATAGFVLWHTQLIALPLSLCAGYALALMVLAIYASRQTSLFGAIWTPHTKPIFRNFGHMFALDQTAFLFSGIGRFFSSYLLSGSIAAYGYATQTLAPAYEFLAFDELYIIPLSSTEQRQEKLNRLLCGILLITVPLAVFLGSEARSLIQLLYQRGQFNAQASDLTAMIMAISAIGLISGAIETPLTRTLQIADHVIYNTGISLVNAALLVAFNALFIFHLRMDVRGMSWATVSTGLLTTLYTIYWLQRADIRLNLFRLSKYLVWASLTGLTAAFAVHLLPRTGHTLADVALAGLTFSLITALFYWPVRNQIRSILYG